MDDLTKLSIPELGRLYGLREIRPAEVVGAYLERIERLDRSVGAFLEIFRDGAMKRAAELEDSDRSGKPLFGVPIAIKDNICTRGRPTTASSRILEHYCPPYDATVIGLLEGAGAVIIGKANLDEFAMGSSTENSAFKITRNPWHLDYAPGGSSGGSAAAVASGMALVALGSDTGGSIRQPAGLCGVVGLKGTYGRVSRYGLIAFASSLDQIGPITRDVRDCAITMQVISGHDPCDATTIREGAPDLLTGLYAGVGGMRIAVPAGLETWSMDESVRNAIMLAIEELENAGAETETIELPGMDTSIACYYILANAEASSNLARYDGVRYGLREGTGSLIEMYEKTRGKGFGEEVKRRILLGTYVLSAGYYDAYYSKAQQVRTLIREGFETVFKHFDLIVMPTSPTPAFRLGERIDDPITMYLSDIFTTAANIAGVPAISIPACLSSGGLPIGVQLMAGKGREAVLLRAAAVLESAFRFGERYSPGVCGEGET